MLSSDGSTPASARELPSISRTRPVRVSPSLMCADMGCLQEAVRALECAGASMLHIDVADGHFVPNLLLGFDLIRWLRMHTVLPLDIHLMVDNPDSHIGSLAQIGVNRISVHVEVCTHLDRVLAEISGHGIEAGTALNPATPLDQLEFVLERLDFVLLMTVNPGFAGQSIVPAAFRKIAACRQLLQGGGSKASIAVDGNVSFENIPRLVAAGADVLVLGTSSWFSHANSLAENVRLTENAIRSGIALRAEASRTPG